MKGVILVPSSLVLLKTYGVLVDILVVPINGTFLLDAFVASPSDEISFELWMAPSRAVVLETSCEYSGYSQAIVKSC